MFALSIKRYTSGHLMMTSSRLSCGRVDWPTRVDLNFGASVTSGPEAAGKRDFVNTAGFVPGFFSIACPVLGLDSFCNRFAGIIYFYLIGNGMEDETAAASIA